MKIQLTMIGGALIALMSLAACGSNNQDSKSNAEQTAATTETVEAPAAEADIQVIDFYATWCGPCKQLAPIIEKMEKKYAGKIAFSRVDVDAEPQLAEQYHITAMPTLVYVKGGEVIDVTVGLMSEEELDAKLEDLTK